MRVTIKITAGKQAFNVEHIVVQTNAPKAYDYGMVIRVEGYEGGVRIVAIPKDDFVVQTGRYASGMYFAAPLDEYADEATILDAITNKLFRE